jgi:putative molybdopterin biosynthesis protein
MAVAVPCCPAGRRGPGRLFSAKALGLDFIPVTTERYDLAIPEFFWDDPRIQNLLEFIRSEEFMRAVLKLGGYGVEQLSGAVAQERPVLSGNHRPRGQSQA